MQGANSREVLILENEYYQDNRRTKSCSGNYHVKVQRLDAPEIPKDNKFFQQQQFAIKLKVNICFFIYGNLRNSPKWPVMV